VFFLFLCYEQSKLRRGLAMKRFYLIFVLFFTLLNSAYADNEVQEENGEGPGVGIGGTVFETWGFTYRQYFPGELGFAASLGGWINSYRRREFDGKIGLAAGASYTFAHHHFPNSGLPSSSLRIYGIAYLAGILRNDYDYYYSDDKNRIDQRILAFDLGAGPGIGAEFFFTKNFAIHLELPWMTFVTFNRYGGRLKSSYPHIGGGLSYYF
jgi:hypothetical protein